MEGLLKLGLMNVSNPGGTLRRERAGLAVVDLFNLNGVDESLVEVERNQEHGKSLYSNSIDSPLSDAKTHLPVMPSGRSNIPILDNMTLI